MSKEFVEKDSKVGYIIVIVILVLAVIGLGGYIGYEFYLDRDKCDAPIEENVKEEISNPKDSYELSYSDAEEYMDKISVYNNHFSSYFLSKTSDEITNDDLLTFAFRMIDYEGIVTKEKVEDVLHKYFGKNVKFKHGNIKCYAGETIYEYDEEKGYVKKEHSGHGGAGSLNAEMFYVSSVVKGNKVKIVVKNLFERYCGDICGPVDAYYATVKDVFEGKNAVLEAEEGQEEARLYRWNKEEVLEKVPETTYNFIIEDNGNFYLESASVGK